MLYPETGVIAPSIDGKRNFATFKKSMNLKQIKQYLTFSIKTLHGNAQESCQTNYDLGS